jgi:small-conductance mechanosensitive channel
MNILRTWTFKWWEMGLIKVCLISLGIILAIYFYSSLSGLLWLWWTLFIVTLLVIMPKTIKEVFRG